MLSKARREIAVDRGYNSKANEDKIVDLGVNISACQNQDRKLKIDKH